MSLQTLFFKSKSCCQRSLLFLRCYDSFPLPEVNDVKLERQNFCKLMTVSLVHRQFIHTLPRQRQRFHWLQQRQTFTHMKHRFWPRLWNAYIFLPIRFLHKPLEKRLDKTTEKIPVFISLGQFLLLDAQRDTKTTGICLFKYEEARPQTEITDSSLKGSEIPMWSIIAYLQCILGAQSGNVFAFGLHSASSEKQQKMLRLQRWAEIGYMISKQKLKS